MASTLDISKLLSAFEEYYLDAGQNKSRLIRSLVQPAVTFERYARQIRTRETTFRLANYEYGSVIQPFSTKFEPISNIKFFPNETFLEPMKVNVQITPHDIEQGYLGFMAGDETRTLQDWPIVRWLLEEYIAKQIQADRELYITYKGKKKVGGKTPIDCMDGIKERLVKGATADYPINIIKGIGKLNATQIFDQIESFSKGIPDLYVGEKVSIFVAPKWVRAYREAKRDRGTYFIPVNGSNQIDERVDFTNHKLVPLPSMAGTDDIWASVDNNLLWLTKREGNLSQASIQLHHYNVDILLDWWEATNFACNQEVWTTEETVTVDESSGS